MLLIDYPKYEDSQAWADSVDPEQTSQNVVSDQGIHCLSLIKQFLDTSAGGQMDLFSCFDKYG